MEGNSFQELVSYVTSDITKRLVNGNIQIPGYSGDYRNFIFRMNRLEDHGIDYGVYNEREEAKKVYNYSISALENFLSTFNIEDLIKSPEIQFVHLKEKKSPFELKKETKGYKFNNKLRVLPVKNLNLNFKLGLEVNDYAEKKVGMDVNFEIGSESLRKYITKPVSNVREDLYMYRSPIFISSSDKNRMMNIGGLAVQAMRNMLEPATTGRIVRLDCDTDIRSKYPDLSKQKYIDTISGKLMEEERVVAYGIVNQWLNKLDNKFNFTDEERKTWSIGRVFKPYEDISTKNVEEFGIEEIILYYYSRSFNFTKFMNGQFVSDVERLMQESFPGKKE